jgi:hypothetical protein
VAVFASSLAETLAAVETQDAAPTSSVSSVSEALAVADTVSSFVVTAASLAEALAANDNVTGALSVSASRAETLSIADTQSVTKSAADGVSESLASAETVSSIFTGAGVCAEVLSASDMVSATLIQITPPHFRTGIRAGFGAPDVARPETQKFNRTPSAPSEVRSGPASSTRANRQFSGTRR